MPAPSLRLLALSLAFAAAGPAFAQPRCDPPRALFVMDKSSSMLERLPDGGSKWDAARTALGAVAADFEGHAEVGLLVFPHPDRCEPGAITAEVAPTTAEVLLAGLGEPPPAGGSYTPMAQSLDAIAGYAPMLDPEIDSHVVLVTDGWQWCSPHDPATRFTPVASVERLRALGLTVHVVGFGVGVDSLTLNRAAVAGGTALPGCDPALTDPMAANHCYLQAHDLAGLRAALGGIARAILEEVCDGWDNDCDGGVDEGFDRDRDGYTVCGTDPDMPGVLAVERRDCDDERSLAFPGAGEACNGFDDDCDGVVDPGCGCANGERRACGSTMGACAAGTQICLGGVWGACEGGVTARRAEGCDGADDDCDGTVDEEAGCGAGELCLAGRCEPLEPETPPPGPEPEPEPEEPVGPRAHPAMGAGCACRSAGAGLRGTGVRGTEAFGVLLALLWVRRRRAYS